MIPIHLNFKHLKNRVSIETVLTDKGLLRYFKKYENKLIGPCPVHGGDNPHAFVVDLYRNIWHCFTKCSGGGDLIDLVRKMDHKSYRQTAEYLASLNDISPDDGIRKNLNPVKVKTFYPYTKKLYLNPESIWLQKKGINSITARKYEVGTYCGNGFLKDCIGVRLHDIFGNPLGYAGRHLNSIQIKNYGKWKFPSKFPKSSILFNFHRVKNICKNGLVVVEGPWGVLRLAQLGIPAVSLLGVSLSQGQFELLCKIPCIIIMLDGDSAGKIGASRLKKTLEAHTIVQIFILPPNHDPDDLKDNELQKVSKFFLS